MFFRIHHHFLAGFETGPKLNAFYKQKPKVDTPYLQLGTRTQGGMGYFQYESIKDLRSLQWNPHSSSGSDTGDRLLAASSRRGNSTPKRFFFLSIEVLATPGTLNR
jgi:hypothetical protein